MKSQKSKAILQLFTGLLLVMACCALLIGTPWLERWINRAIKIIKPDGLIFHIWRKYPPMTHKIYMFDWKNPEDLYDPKVKPRFEEVGPFVFEYQSEKANITWNNNNNTVTFRNLRYWYFNETQSVANFSRNIVTVNALPYVTAYRTRYWNSGLQRIAGWFLRKVSPKMYLEKSVGEILFHGYDDPFLDLANVVFIPQMLDFPLYDKVGWLRLRNGSQEFEDYLNTDTRGENMGQVNQWNFLSRLPFYRGECNTIKGSVGEFFHVSSPKDRIYLFLNDVCRSVAFDFEKEAFYRGIKTHVYTAKNMFDNGSLFEENKCYQFGEDLPSGIFNLSACRYGTPTFASLPHFYGADPYYLNRVDGLNPIKEKHDMIIMIEPNTGIALYARVRIQANMLLQRNEYFSMFANVPKLYLPIFWIEHCGDIPDYYITYLKIFLNLGIVMRLSAVLIACGGIFLLTLGLRGRNILAEGKTVGDVPEKTDEISQLLEKKNSD